VQADDPYLAIHNLGLLQRQAGVDAAVAELVVAYGRLLVDGGEPLVFDRERAPAGSRERKWTLSLRHKNPEIDERFLRFLAAYCARMEARGFLPLLGVGDLAERLGFETVELRALAAKTRWLYREIRMPRPGRNDRIVYSPREPIRRVQRWILKHILRNYAPHSAAHGFVQGRSIVSNAAEHTGASILMAIDLADFFPSIDWKRVRKAFEKLGYPYSVAVVLANLCTRTGYLPQGASTSPALSNLICERLDRRLSGLARSRGFRYSRYADDLAFSSADSRLPALLPFIRQIVREEGFEVRDRKTRVARSGARQLVTGVVVNEHLNLPRAHVRRLRAAAHRLATRGATAVSLDARPSADPARVLHGHLAFLAMVNPSRGRTLTSLARRSEPGQRDPDLA
jgi:retron-type reverse transcriptase